MLSDRKTAKAVFDGAEKVNDFYVKFLGEQIKVFFEVQYVVYF